MVYILGGSQQKKQHMRPSSKETKITTKGAKSQITFELQRDEPRRKEEALFTADPLHVGLCGRSPCVPTAR